MQVTGTRISRGIGVGLEIPIEITSVGKETATEWFKKLLHCINIMIEEKVLKCKKVNYFFKKMKVFFCNPALSLSFPMRKWGCPSYISKTR